MQYIINQGEYDEFMLLRKMFENRGKKSMGSSCRKVYELYCKNPSLTYEKASKILSLSPANIYKHINNLCDRGYLEKDASGKIIHSQ